MTNEKPQGTLTIILPDGTKVTLTADELRLLKQMQEVS